MTRRMPAPSRLRGFTLLETALSVVAMGVVLGTIVVARTESGSKTSAVADASFMNEVVSRVFGFAQRNNRLPCPDVNADGFEDATDGVCPPDIKSGGVPYATLGIALSAPVGTGLDLRFVYGVYRGGGLAGTDLTVAGERSLPAPHAATSASHANRDDLKQAVISGMLQNVSASEVHVTGNDVDTGASDCQANVVANMAFVVAFSGNRNADEQGGDFDGAHLVDAVWSAGNRWASVKGNTCFVGPGKPVTPTYDDQVRAVSFVELLGVLNR